LANSEILRLSKLLSCDGEAVKEVEDENALKHMFDKAHLKRTADPLVAAYPHAHTCSRANAI